MDDWSMIERLSDEHHDALLIALSKPNGIAQLGDLSDELGWDHEQAVEITQDLREQRLGQSDESAAGELTLSSKGKRIAQLVSGSRTSGTSRADAVQRHFLAWLAGYEHPTLPTKFLAENAATAYGTAFTEEEVQQAAAYLETQGLLIGVGTLQGGALLRVKISPQGRAALSTKRAISQLVGTRPTTSQYTDNRVATHITQSAVGGVQTGGAGNTQHVTMNLTADQRSAVVNEVADIVRRLDETGVEDAEPLRAALVAVKSEAENGTAESLKDRILAAIVKAAASETTKFAVQSLILLAGGLVT